MTTFLFYFRKLWFRPVFNLNLDADKYGFSIPCLSHLYSKFFFRYFKNVLIFSLSNKKQTRLKLDKQYLFDLLEIPEVFYGQNQYFTKIKIALYKIELLILARYRYNSKNHPPSTKFYFKN